MVPADMVDLPSLPDEHMVEQESDLILYGPEDDRDVSPPPTRVTSRIHVRDLWSPKHAAGSGLHDELDGGATSPERAPANFVTPRMSLLSVFDAAVAEEVQPVAAVSVALSTVFPDDRSQVLDWHPNRTLLAIVQLVFASVKKISAPRRGRTKKFRPVLVLAAMKGKRYQPGNCSAAQRTAGRDTFRRVIAAVTGSSVRTTAKATDAAWLRLSTSHRNAWAEMTRILSTPEISELPDVKLLTASPAGSVKTLQEKQETCRDEVGHFQVTGYGVSLCFNTDFGQGNVETIRLVQNGLRGSALRTALAQLGAYQEFFDRFYHHFQARGRELGLPLVTCAMEHSMKGDHPARVHLHCFMGVDIRGGIFGKAVQEVTICKERLAFEGLRPTIGVTSVGRKRNVVIHTAVVQSYYYVAGPKIGKLLCRGVAVLFQACPERLTVPMEFGSGAQVDGSQQETCIPRLCQACS